MALPVDIHFLRHEPLVLFFDALSHFLGKFVIDAVAPKDTVEPGWLEWGVWWVIRNVCHIFAL